MRITLNEKCQRVLVLDLRLVTFRVSRRRREMYLVTLVCVSVCVCLSVSSLISTLLHGPACNVGNGSGCPLVVHYWADLESVHALRCYGNIARTRNVSECLYSLYARFAVVMTAI